MAKNVLLPNLSAFIFPYIHISCSYYILIKKFLRDRTKKGCVIESLGRK